MRTKCLPGGNGLEDYFLKLKLGFDENLVKGRWQVLCKSVSPYFTNVSLKCRQRLVDTNTTTDCFYNFLLLQKLNFYIKTQNGMNSRESRGEVYAHRYILHQSFMPNEHNFAQRSLQSWQQLFLFLCSIL